MEKMAALLRKLRVDAGLTQAALAQEMGYDPTYVSAVERGVRPPSWAYLVGFANAVGANVVTLLREAGLVGPNTVDLEQEIAALIEQWPDFARVAQAARELGQYDPLKLKQLADFARFLLEEGRPSN